MDTKKCLEICHSPAFSLRRRCCGTDRRPADVKYWCWVWLFLYQNFSIFENIYAKIYEDSIQPATPFLYWTAKKKCQWCVYYVNTFVHKYLKTWIGMSENVWFRHTSYMMCLRNVCPFPTRCQQTGSNCNVSSQYLVHPWGFFAVRYTFIIFCNHLPIEDHICIQLI